MAVLCSMLNRKEAYFALKELEEIEGSNDNETSPRPAARQASNSSMSDGFSPHEIWKADSSVFRRRFSAHRRDWTCISSR